MSPSANRFTGATLILAGIPVALWAAYDMPHDWWTWWTRAVLGLTALGAISLGARFVYPDRDTDTLGGTPDGDGVDDTRV
ncbi:hypothetical protein [Streptomyces sp. AC495_CC817]|uniref:hypothetical protein n=1 Tax=Streptomyces sp. AC495_CC817 TaxID=2823900 RepID=UPI001C252E08|nr:hypothetical protein [Streptomyces sp. AC495_CC817]